MMGTVATVVAGGAVAVVGDAANGTVSATCTITA